MCGMWTKVRVLQNCQEAQVLQSQRAGLTSHTHGKLDRPFSCETHTHAPTITRAALNKPTSLLNSDAMPAVTGDLQDKGPPPGYWVESLSNVGYRHRILTHKELDKYMATGLW